MEQMLFKKSNQNKKPKAKKQKDIQEIIISIRKDPEAMNQARELIATC